ncbi:MAG: MXAN_2562 family outer membrane beta-barrel protein [Polyangiaceae bacterium]
MRGCRVVVSGSAVVFGVLGWASSALAQEDRQDVLGGRHKMYETSQHFAFELRFAPFTPEVDSDPALHGATPFATTLGNFPRLMFQGEFDWQALRIPHLGTLGPGIGVGYTKMSGDAQFLSPHGPNGILNSGESTSLTIFPFYAVAVLRADVVKREGHIPLVPYAKLGFGYSIWRASNSVGTSVYAGRVGVGGSMGTELGLGLAFNLNVFDEYAAKNFDEGVGVNNTYAFAEYTRADLDGLGIQSDPLRVGGQSWTFGLAFEF